MIKDDLNDVNDYELIMLYREDDEDAKNLLFLKYKFIIDILIRKYKAGIVALNIDFQEVYSECTVAFSDALKSFKDSKNASLPTFITLCVERRLKGVLRKYNRNKYKDMHESYSLDFVYDDVDSSLMNSISDEGEFDPLKNMTDKERYQEFICEIKNSLTQRENDVFVLMINGLNYREIAKILNKTDKQVDNTMQRIKGKIKSLLNEQMPN